METNGPRRKPDSFNWVGACIACRPKEQFDAIQSDVEDAVRKRNEELVRSDAPVRMGFSNYGTGFCVSKDPVAGYHAGQDCVNFDQATDGFVIRDLRAHGVKSVTPFLDDEGECRFRINGEGSHQRWQVIRLALEPLFFQRRPTV